MSDRSTTAIEFADVTFRVADDKVLLANISLSVRRGETLVLVGRSGSGKTTCLKMINRLYAPNAGKVRVDGIDIAQWNVIKLRRGIGYAIQEVGLFPHYSVHENVALVPKLEQWEPGRIAARVEEVLALVGMPAKDFAGRYPHQLSGGQRQRVGLARALAANPPILLMDEPFGALDPLTRAELQTEFKQLQHQLGKTIVFVTHDVGEALLLGDRIGLMEAGRLRGVYRGEEFLRAPDDSVKAYVDVFRAGQQIFRN
jgi:osmoprotectant transport system ATP-binding protein